MESYSQIKNAKEKDYKQIAEICGIDSMFFVESSIARGGCFWSERYAIPVPGVLQKGKTIETKEFINNLKKVI